MSMNEALRHLRGVVPWLNRGEDEQYLPPKPKTPTEDAADMVLLAQQGGLLDKSSPTWMAVAHWAASELIKTQRALEAAQGDAAAMLRARAKTLRELLAMDRPTSAQTIEDIGPDIP